MLTAPAPSHVLSMDEASQGLHVQTLTVPANEVVYLKALLEAHEGIGAMFAESGGALMLGTTPSMRAELEEFVAHYLADRSTFREDA